jgi:hypothetical protein
MKYLILVILLSSFSQGYCQSLTGIWEGWFLDPNKKNDTITIKLDFRVKQDGTYEVYDFTNSDDFKTACRMTYRLINKNTIYLEEVEVTRTNKPVKMVFLQNMKLQIDESFKNMKGRWSCNIKKLRCDGMIYFVKTQ